MKGETIGFIILFSLLFIIMGTILLQVTIFNDSENITVKGYITDYELYDDYISLTFDNGKTYDVNYPNENIDFTHNSILVVKLWKSGWILCFPPGEYYDILEIYKFEN